jgi:hypothetical protein
MDIENRPTRANNVPPQREFGRLVFQEQGGEMTFALAKPVVIIGRFDLPTLVKVHYETSGILALRSFVLADLHCSACHILQLFKLQKIGMLGDDVLLNNGLGGHAGTRNVIS